MTRLALVVLAVALAVALAIIAGTAMSLPPRVASHFDGSGAATGFLARERYTLVMLLVTGLVPIAVTLRMAWLPAGSRFGRVKLPHADFWLAPQRLAVTRQRLAAWGAIFGAMLALFLAGIHLLVVDANGRSPPHLALAPLFGLLAAFLVAVLVWALALRRAFRDLPPA